MYDSQPYNEYSQIPILCNLRFSYLGSNLSQKYLKMGICTIQVRLTTIALHKAIQNFLLLHLLSQMEKCILEITSIRIRNIKSHLLLFSQNKIHFFILKSAIHR
jgi:hypothetical protein